MRPAVSRLFDNLEIFLTNDTGYLSHSDFHKYVNRYMKRLNACRPFRPIEMQKLPNIIEKVIAKKSRMTGYILKQNPKSFTKSDLENILEIYFDNSEKLDELHSFIKGLLS